MYLELLFAEIHFSGDVYKGTGKPFGDLVRSSRSLSRRNEHEFCYTVTAGRHQPLGRTTLTFTIVEMTPVKRDIYLSPWGIMANMSEKANRVAENTWKFFLALPNPDSRRVFHASMVESTVSFSVATLGGP